MKPNSTFGRYQIIRSLGAGGMASVYLARDPQLDRMVALKVPDLAGGNPQILARFRLEATAVARWKTRPSFRSMNTATTAVVPIW